jgi:hypothetical protein
MEELKIERRKGSVPTPIEVDPAMQELSPNPFRIFSPATRTPSSTPLTQTRSMISLHKTASGLRKVLGAFATLPPKETWIRSELVERQTVSTDRVWLPRLMILTSDAVIFAKEGSEIILDRFPLKNIIFIGKVRNQPRT